MREPPDHILPAKPTHEWEKVSLHELTVVSSKLRDDLSSWQQRVHGLDLETEDYLHRSEHHKPHARVAQLLNQPYLSYDETEEIKGELRDLWLDYQEVVRSIPRLLHTIRGEIEQRIFLQRQMSGGEQAPDDREDASQVQQATEERNLARSKLEESNRKVQELENKLRASTEACERLVTEKDALLSALEEEQAQTDAAQASARKLEEAHLAMRAPTATVTVTAGDGGEAVQRERDELAREVASLRSQLLEVGSTAERLRHSQDIKKNDNLERDVELSREMASAVRAAAAAREAALSDEIARLQAIVEEQTRGQHEHLSRTSGALLKREAEDLQAQLLSLSDVVESQNRQIEGYRTQLKKEQADAAAQHSLAHEKVKDDAEQKVRHAEERWERDNAALKDAEKELDRLRAERTSTQDLPVAKRALLERQRDDAKTELAGVERQRDEALKELARTGGELEKTKRELEEAERESDATKTELAGVERQRYEALKELARTGGELEEAKSELEEAKRELAGECERRAEAEEQRDEAQRDCEAAERGREEARLMVSSLDRPNRESNSPGNLMMMESTAPAPHEDDDLLAEVELLREKLRDRTALVADLKRRADEDARRAPTHEQVAQLRVYLAEHTAEEGRLQAELDRATSRLTSAHLEDTCAEGSSPRRAPRADGSKGEHTDSDRLARCRAELEEERALRKAAPGGEQDIAKLIVSAQAAAIECAEATSRAARAEEDLRQQAERHAQHTSEQEAARVALVREVERLAEECTVGAAALARARASHHADAASNMSEGSLRRTRGRGSGGPMEEEEYIQGLQAELEEAGQDLARAVAQATAAHRMLSQIDQRLIAAQDAYQGQLEENVTVRGDMAVVQRRLDAAKNDIRDLEGEVSRLRSREAWDAAHHDDAAEQFQKDCRRLEEEYKAKLAREAASRTEAVAAKEAEITELLARVRAHAHDIKRLEKTKAALDTQLARGQRVAEEAEEAAVDLARCRGRLRDAERERDEEASARLAALGEVKRLRERADAADLLEAELETARARVRTAGNERDAARAERSEAADALRDARRSIATLEATAADRDALRQRCHDLEKELASTEHARSLLLAEVAEARDARELPTEQRASRLRAVDVKARDELRAARDEAVTKAARLEMRVADLEATVADTQARLQAEAEQRAELASAVAADAGTLARALARGDALQIERDALAGVEDKLESAHRQHQALREDKARLETELSQARREAAANSSAPEDAKAARASARELRQALAAEEGARVEAEALSRELEGRAAVQSAKVADLTASRRELEERLQRTEDALARATEGTASADEELRSLREVAQEQAHLHQQLRQARRNAAADTARVQALEESVRDAHAEREASEENARAVRARLRDALAARDTAEGRAEAERVALASASARIAALEDGEDETERLRQAAVSQKRELASLRARVAALEILEESEAALDAASRDMRQRVRAAEEARDVAREEATRERESARKAQVLLAEAEAAREELEGRWRDAEFRAANLARRDHDGGEQALAVMAETGDERVAACEAAAREAREALRAHVRELEGVRGELVEAQRARERAEAEAKRAAVATAALEAQVQSARNERDATRASLDRALQDGVQSAAARDAAADELARLQGEVDRLRELLPAAQDLPGGEEIRELLRERQASAADAAAARESCDALRDENYHLRLRSAAAETHARELEEKEGDLVDAKRAARRAREACVSAEAAAAEAAADCERAEHERATIVSDLQAAQEQLRAATLNMENLRQDAERLEAERDALRSSEALASAEVEDAAQELSLARESLLIADAEAEALRSSVANLSALAEDAASAATRSSAEAKRAKSAVEESSRRAQAAEERANAAEVELASLRERLAAADAALEHAEGELDVLRETAETMSAAQSFATERLDAALARQSEAEARAAALEREALADKVRLAALEAKDAVLVEDLDRARGEVSSAAAEAARLRAAVDQDRAAGEDMARRLADAQANLSACSDDLARLKAELNVRTAEVAALKAKLAFVSDDADAAHVTNEALAARLREAEEAVARAAADLAALEEGAQERVDAALADAESAQHDAHRLAERLALEQAEREREREASTREADHLRATNAELQGSAAALREKLGALRGELGELRANAISTKRDAELAEESQLDEKERLKRQLASLKSAREEQERATLDAVHALADARGELDALAGERARAEVLAKQLAAAEAEAATLAREKAGLLQSLREAVADGRHAYEMDAEAESRAKSLSQQLAEANANVAGLDNKVKALKESLAEAEGNAAAAQKEKRRAEDEAAHERGEMERAAKRTQRDLQDELDQSLANLARQAAEQQALRDEADAFHRRALAAEDAARLLQDERRARGEAERLLAEKARRLADEVEDSAMRRDRERELEDALKSAKATERLREDELTKLRDELAALQTELARAATRSSESSTAKDKELASLSASLADVEGRAGRAEESLSSCQERLAAAEERAEGAELRADAAEQECRDLEDEIARLGKKLQTLASESQAAREEIARSQRELANARAATSGELRDTQDALQVAEGHVRRLERRADELEGELESTTAAFNGAKRDLAEALAEISGLRSRVAASKDQKQTLDGMIDDLEDARRQLAAALARGDDLEHQVELARKDVHSGEAARNALADKLSSAEQRLAQSHLELDALRDTAAIAADECSTAAAHAASERDALTKEVAMLKEEVERLNHALGLRTFVDVDDLIPLFEEAFAKYDDARELAGALYNGDLRCSAIARTSAVGGILAVGGGADVGRGVDSYVAIKDAFLFVYESPEAGPNEPATVVRLDGGSVRTVEGNGREGARFEIVDAAGHVHTFATADVEARDLWVKQSTGACAWWDGVRGVVHQSDVVVQNRAPRLSLGCMVDA